MRVPSVADVIDAREVVLRHLAPTPVVRAPALGSDVRLKLETLQPTGSFKVRGALVAVARSARTDPSRPIVTASAGNHGLGVAYAAAVAGARATVVVPQNASPVKVAALERFPIELRSVGTSYDDAEAHALELAEAGALFVSPYNDPDTIAGQGTIALELFDAVPGLDTIVVPVGGGGLISGVALAASAQDGVRVIGVEATSSPAMTIALRDGETGTVDVQPTLADGLAGNLEPGTVTVDLVRRLVDEVVVVTEDEIEDGMRFLAREHGLVVEGSAAVGVAALLHSRLDVGSTTTAVVLTGRNISVDAFARVLTG